MTGPDSLPGLDDYLTPDDPEEETEMDEETKREMQMERDVADAEDREYYRSIGWD